MLAKWGSYFVSVAKNRRVELNAVNGTPPRYGNKGICIRAARISNRNFFQHFFARKSFVTGNSLCDSVHNVPFVLCRGSETMSRGEEP